MVVQNFRWTDHFPSTVWQIPVLFSGSYWSHVTHPSLGGSQLGNLLLPFGFCLPFSGIMQNALGCGCISIFPLSLLSAAGALPSQFWPLLHQRLFKPHPDSFHSPVPVGVSDCVQCWRQVTPAHSFSLHQIQQFGNGNGYSSHFPNFPGSLSHTPIFLFHFFRSYFIVSCPPWWMLFLHSSPGCYRHTYLCVWSGNLTIPGAAVPTSRQLPMLGMLACRASRLRWACVFPTHPPVCVGLGVLRGAPWGSLGCCGSLPRTVFQGLSGAGWGYPALAPSKLYKFGSHYSLGPELPTITGAYGACTPLDMVLASLTALQTALSCVGQAVSFWLSCFVGCVCRMTEDGRERWSMSRWAWPLWVLKLSSPWSHVCSLPHAWLKLLSQGRSQLTHSLLAVKQNKLKFS